MRPIWILLPALLMASCTAESKPQEAKGSNTVGASSLASSMHQLNKSSEAEADPPHPNTNRLMKRYSGQVLVTCSSEWNNWPATRIADGDRNTSWFSLGDQADVGSGHWIAINFPEAVTVSRVTILGNRDETGPKGFSVRAGRIELSDESGQVLYKTVPTVSGKRYDFDAVMSKQITGVKHVRFTATEDDQRLNGAASVALAEMLIE